MTDTIIAELARRLQRKSIIVMVTAACLWLTVMPLDKPVWSWQWWGCIALGVSLVWTFLTAAQDFRYARWVLAEPETSPAGGA